MRAASKQIKQTRAYKPIMSCKRTTEIRVPAKSAPGARPKARADFGGARHTAQRRIMKTIQQHTLRCAVKHTAPLLFAKYRPTALIHKRLFRARLRLCTPWIILQLQHTITRVPDAILSSTSFRTIDLAATTIKLLRALLFGLHATFSAPSH